MDPRGFRSYLDDRRDEMVEALGALVRHESPSHDKAALDPLARAIGDRLAAIGGEVEIQPNDLGGDHLAAQFDFGHDEAPATLLLTHYDTVWPVGTLAEMPFRVDAERAYGPGSYDMKASLVIAEFALEAVIASGLRPPRPVVLLATSDEEVGSPTSRRLIEVRARHASHVLVLEPALVDGRLKTARKGVGHYWLEIIGRAAHAGVEPEKGIDAVRELASQVLAIHALANPAAGTTVNVGMVKSSAGVNVVAASASAMIDVRAATTQEAGRMHAALVALPSIDPRAIVRVRGAFNRPPMERTEAVAALFGRAKAIGATIGLDLGEGSTGGGSDGNFTAALGISTLDGLGALGGGAHARDEHVRINSLPERAALLAMLILEL